MNVTTNMVMDTPETMTIGMLYKPLIRAAADHNPVGHAYLCKAGEEMHRRFPQACPTIADGVAQVKRNLAYYVGYYSNDTVKQVREFYGLEGNREE